MIQNRKRKVDLSRIRQIKDQLIHISIGNWNDQTNKRSVDTYKHWKLERSIFGNNIHPQLNTFSTILFPIDLRCINYLLPISMAFWIILYCAQVPVRSCGNKIIHIRCHFYLFRATGHS